MGVPAGLFLAQQNPGGGFETLLLSFLLVTAIFYFLVIRPTRKRQKSLEAMISSLKNGDKVITTGGIYGTISGVREHTFIVKVSDQAKIEIAKNAVASMQSPPEQ